MATKKSLEAEKKEALEEELENTEIQPSRKRKYYQETYHEVMFQEKSNPNDTNDVQLAVNGECLQIKRGVPVVVPQRFLEAADHTKYPIYEQLPDKPRKVVSWITTYPYTKLRDATKEEFETMKKSGDTIARQVRERMEDGGGV